MVPNKLNGPRKEAEWSTELAEAIAVVCKRWDGTVVIPCLGVGLDVLTDLRAMYAPLGVTVTHCIGGTRALVAAASGVQYAATMETLTFKGAR